MKRMRATKLAQTALQGVSSISKAALERMERPETENGQEPTAAAEGSSISQAELQEGLQRVTSQFIERSVQAFEQLRADARPELLQSSLWHMLRLSSSALDIATGQYPEVNLLDLMVFFRLSRLKVEEYWVPHVYGLNGEELLQALRRAEEDLMQVAQKVATEEQQHQIEELVDAWRKDNPGQIYVERVRLTEFSQRAGHWVGERTEGLLSSVRSAVASADQAVLMGNRALLLAKTMPALMRLQARLGAQEVLSDSLSRLKVSHAYPQVEQLIWTVTRALVVVGAAWATSWWGGYRLAHRSRGSRNHIARAA